MRNDSFLLGYPLPQNSTLLLHRLNSSPSSSPSLLRPSGQHRFHLHRHTGGLHAESKPRRASWCAWQEPKRYVAGFPPSEVLTPATEVRSSRWAQRLGQGCSRAYPELHYIADSLKICPSPTNRERPKRPKPSPAPPGASTRRREHPVSPLHPRPSRGVRSALLNPSTNSSCI